MTDFTNDVKTALEDNVDKSEEEYAKINADADSSTEKHGHGETKKMSEATRHKRIQSNFYGTSTNILLNILVSLNETNRLLTELLKEKNDAGEH